MGHLPLLKLSVLAHNKQKPLKDYKHMLSLQKFFNNVSADKARTPVRFIIGLATGLVGIADMLSAIVPKLNWDILLGSYTSDFPQGPQKLTVVRSEEHTSELQSQSNLVCRLLLEKQK